MLANAESHSDHYTQVVPGIKKEGMGAFKQKVAQQSSAHPRQKAAVMVKQMPWTQGAAWHTSDGPVLMFLCTAIKKRQVGVNALTTLRRNHEQHMTSRVLGKEGDRATSLCQAAQ